jgi:tRNA(fMet)-specific endonuclease VapC
VSGRYILDTNVVIAILEREIDLESIRSDGREIFLNSIVLGELFFGAEKSQRLEENRARIRFFASVCPVLPCDEDTARYYGAVKFLLQKKGRPIPENDIWIAASARQHGLILASRDGHFEYVEDLVFESW